MPESLIVRLARDVAIAPKQAEAAVELLDGGATIAVHCALPQGRRPMALMMCSCAFWMSVWCICANWTTARRGALASIREQGKLSDDLAVALDRATSKREIRGPLRAVQAEAAHQGCDCARGRACSRWPMRSTPTGVDATRQRRRSSSTPTLALPMRRRAWMARATSCRSSGPGCFAGRQAARMAVDQRPV